MSLILQLGLVIFIIYIFWLISGLVKSTRAWGHYSVRCNWMSELGISTKNSAATFNYRISLFGLLSLFLVFNLYTLVPATNIWFIFLMFLASIGVCTFFVGVFPMDTKPNSHLLASGGTFFSVLIASFLSIYLTITFDVLPKALILINLFTLIIIPIYALAAGYEHTAKTPLQKFIVRNKGLWEWSAFALSCAWNLIMSFWVLAELVN